jgi:hypothetical protein
VTRIRTSEIVALIGVLILAAMLRFGWPGVSSFAFDEARLSLISLNMARGGQFATLGMPSSVGVPNLPAAAWIYAIPYALSSDPLVATLFTGLISLLAVIGLWLLARVSWGMWPALITALFMAASPYSVLYSRSVWAQNLLPPLAVAWVGTAYLGSAKGSRVAIALNIFLAGFAFQVHFAGIGLALGTVYLFFRFRWWKQLLPVLIAGGLAGLAALPFLVQVVCCAPQVVDQYRSALGGTPQVDLSSFTELIRLSLGIDWGYLALGDLQVDQPLLIASTAIVLIIGLVALIIGTRHALKEIILVLLLVSPVFFIRHTTPTFIHYQLASLPAVALIAGASAMLIKRRFWPPLMAAVSLFVALGWSLQLGQSLEIAGHENTPNGLGTPLNVTREVAKSIPNDTSVLFFTHGDDTNINGEAAVFDALWWGREHRIINGEALLILPPYPAYFLATLAPFQAWEEIEAAGLSDDVHEFPRREGEGPGFIGTLYNGEVTPNGFTSIDPVYFEHGTQLEGWKARMVGPRLRISTMWRVMEIPPAGIYQQFHHLRTVDTLEGEPIIVADVPVSAHDWQVGDRLIIMGDFFVDQTAEYWVDVGHYTLPNITRIPHTDGDSVRLGPFTLP